MWILIARAPRTDAVVWPGRLGLAALDAVVWPALWILAVANVQIPTGIVGKVVVAVAILSAVRRLYQAVTHNERYRFTTWRWGVPLATGVLLWASIRVIA